jgi:hypothetical protein
MTNERRKRYEQRVAPKNARVRLIPLKARRPVPNPSHDIRESVILLARIFKD